jgi:hypothetical protein
MSRFSPLIARAPVRSGPARFAAIDPLAAMPDLVLSDDVRQFLTAFSGGLIFFLTLLS